MFKERERRKWKVPSTTSSLPDFTFYNLILKQIFVLISPNLAYFYNMQNI